MPHWELRRLLTMNFGALRRAPSGLRIRKSSRNLRASRNRSGPRPVVLGVGKSRGVGAALLAAGLVLSGCTSGDGQSQTTTTTSAVAEAPTNPWDLPFEQRPPLFDPCEEIPVEAVEAIEEALGGSMETMEDLTNREPASLYSCGWSTDEVMLSVLATWRSKQEFSEDTELKVLNSRATMADRIGLRAHERWDQSFSTCSQVFFTSRGAVMTTVDTLTSLNEFRGEKLVKACDIIDEVTIPIIQFYPEGDF